MRIAVLFGGDSEERDVSIASATQIVAALRDRGHDVSVVDTAFGSIEASAEASVLIPGVPASPPSRLQLEAARRSSGSLRLPAEVADADLVFLALHGGAGENGQLQAVLELAGIPYTGSGPLGSAMAMDKDISKRLFRVAGIRTPDWLMAPAKPSAVHQHLGLHAQGSTVGLSLVHTLEALEMAADVAGQYGDVMYAAPPSRSRATTQRGLSARPESITATRTSPPRRYSSSPVPTP